nr:hypothetical protein CFP56_59147 [Quercus suber]
MGRKRDQFWDYAEQRLDGRFKCNFCHGDFPGGATRIKAHLAGVSGHGIVACIAVSQEVQKEARATQETNKKLKCASSSSSANERKITSVSSSVSSSKIMDRIVTQSKEEYIVEIFLDDVVDRLVANVFSFTTEHSKNKELKNLLYTLCKIHVMLYDAQKRQVSDESVRIWLTELKDVVYEVDNALDKFSYDTFLKYQMMNQVPSISLCNFDKVKTINHALDNIVNEVDRLGLKIVNSNPKISLDNDDSERFFEIEALPECLGCLSSLQKLYIVDCNHLAHLPTEEAMRRLTQLKMLIIYDCPNLEDNERSKIDHIPFVDIQDEAGKKFASGNCCLRKLNLSTKPRKGVYTSAVRGTSLILHYLFDMPVASTSFLPVPALVLV